MLFTAILPQDLRTTASPTFAGAAIGTLLLGSGSITDSGGSIVFGDENLTTTGDLTCANLTITSPDGQYVFTNRNADALVLQQTDTSERCQLELFGSLATAQEIAFKLFAEGTPTSLSTTSFIQFTHNGIAGNPFILRTVQSGSPTTDAGLIITTQGSSYQIVLDSGGNVGINAASPSYQLDVGGDIRTTGSLRVGSDSVITGNTNFSLSGISTIMLECTAGNFFFSHSSEDDVNMYFSNGATHTGIFSWKEDEDYFLYADDILLSTDEKLNLRDTTIGIYSQADTYMDLFADGAVRIGNSSGGAPTTYLTVESDADTFWTGDGTGIPYGHMYAASTISVTISDSNPTEILDATSDGFTTGEVNLVTFPSGGDEHYLAVDKAGRYKVEWSLSISQNSPSSAIECKQGIMVNGTAQSKGAAQRTISNATDVGASASSAIFDLAENDQISLFVQNLTNTTNIDVEQANLTIIMVGGT